MRKSVFAVIILLCMLCATTNAQSKVSTTIRRVTAKEVKTIIDSSKGPLIVNFWASWCGPCIREIPWFDSIIEKNNAPVKLLLVSLDFASDYPKKLTDFVKKQGYKGEVVYLQETNADKYIPIIDPKWKGAIPASIFVNHSKNYYQLYNEQIPKQRFEMELNKLVN